MGFDGIYWDIFHQHDILARLNMGHTPEIVILIGNMTMMINQWIQGYIIFRQNHLEIEQLYQGIHYPTTTKGVQIGI